MRQVGWSVNTQQEPSALMTSAFCIQEVVCESWIINVLEIISITADLKYIKLVYFKNRSYKHKQYYSYYHLPDHQKGHNLDISQR